MVKLKYVIYLSILACYVVTQNCGQGETLCNCVTPYSMGVDICNPKNNQVCDLNKGCVASCPTNDL